jgi:hypothetical protein
MPDDVVRAIDHFIPRILADALENVVSRFDAAPLIRPGEEEFLDLKRRFALASLDEYRSSPSRRSVLRSSIQDKSSHRRIFTCPAKEISCRTKFEQCCTALYEAAVKH